MKGLWAAVVVQALNDLGGEKYDSLHYAEAFSFFMNDGEWLYSRQMIADALGCDAYDLERAGKRVLAERRSRETAKSGEAAHSGEFVTDRRRRAGFGMQSARMGNHARHRLADSLRTEKRTA